MKRVCQYIYIVWFLTSVWFVQNYRCVVVLGKARSVTDLTEKAAALLKLTEHIIPGRTQHARAANDKELSQTAVLAVDLNEVSAKVGAHRLAVFLWQSWRIERAASNPIHASNSNAGQVDDICVQGICH